MRWSKPASAPVPVSTPLTSAGPSPLGSLRDVDGVIGGFVIASSGLLVAKDLPAVFDDPLFVELGQRLLRLEETLSDGGGRPESCVLAFTKHELHLRFLPGGVLAVVTGKSVNASALKMALTLAARKIEQELARRASTPAPRSA